MAGKQIVFSEEARRKLQVGMDKLAKAVITTLGPKGRNVALDRSFGSPTITHDGVTVAKEVELSDKLENMGAQLLKEAATKTSDAAGDGTTTATILAEAIYKEGLKNIGALKEEIGLDIEVYGPETHMTNIVSMALKGGK